MTKTKQSFVTDPAQLNLFDAIKRVEAERTAQRPGRMCVTSRLMAAYSLAFKLTVSQRH